MYEALQAKVLKVIVLRKMRKNEADIKTALIHDGMSTEDAERIIGLANDFELKIEEEKKADREKYAGDLNEDLIEELVQSVIEWHVNGNPNDYQIKENLISMGVDGKYHDEIRIEAHDRVRRATHLEANWKILIGIIVAVVGLIIVMLALGATGGGAGAVRILVVPLVAGLAIIAWGLAQKNAI